MRDLTHDAFLGGRLHLWQPRHGYRAGVDPVFLAASVPARAGERVLDLGCGVGAAALCLAARVEGVEVFGVERQADYAALARRNGLPVVEADLAELPAGLRAQSFDHVIANPPYFDRSASAPAQEAGREAALGEVTPLATWVSVAAKRVRPKGYVHFIHRADRVPELLHLMQPVLGSINILPLVPRVGRDAELVIFRARKGGRADFRLCSPIYLHEGAQHLRDGDDYNPLISKVLRDGAALWPL